MGSCAKGEFKLIEFFEEGRLEMFNLKTDIGEKENLASSQRETARAMQRLLSAWRKQVGAQMPVPKAAR
jgi:hypothetical protein